MIRNSAPARDLEFPPARGDGGSIRSPDTSVTPAMSTRDECVVVAGAAHIVSIRREQVALSAPPQRAGIAAGASSLKLAGRRNIPYDRL